MGKKKQGAAIGRTLIKDRFKGKAKHRDSDSHLHTAELNDGYDWNRLNLQSVTEQNTLDDFLATAELAGTEFTAEKLNISVVSPEKYTGLLTKEEKETVHAIQESHKDLLKIPRRPSWDENTTAEELDRKEKDSFLEWRRELATLQEVEGLILTPFERNLDFWRQLWRVIERSDIVVQILDARNPLLFRCCDLEKYVREISERKSTVLLLNKADYLNQAQREYWAQYFQKENVRVAFWSATQEMERIKAEEGDHDLDSDDEVDDEDNSDSDDWETDESLEEDLDKWNIDSDELRQGEVETRKGVPDNTDCNKDTDSKSASNLSHTSSDPACERGISAVDITHTDTEDSDGSAVSACFCNKADILCGDELIEYLVSQFTGKTYMEGVATIGLVGYPNVGKSSTINAILQTKKVPVSVTPGRTKHFQTLYIDKSIMLCDCPGLVMPTFISTKAEMIVNGILPIDQMRDFVPPVSLVCEYIPRRYLEATYGVLLPKPKVDEGEDPDRLPTAYELLTAYSCMRGFMTHKGVPDFQRSARVILKDFITGKLLFSHAPPAVSEESYRPVGEPLKPAKQSKISSGHTEIKGLPFGNVDKDFFHKGERKGTNKYYPPDFDPKKHFSLDKYHGTHALRERAKKLNQGILVIRFEMPYNIWCDGCGNHIGMGVRYNAEKSKAGNYYTTPIWQFRMKCHLCDQYFVIKTDPANHDYVIVSGARRKEQRWDPKDNEQIVTEDKSDIKKMATDAMFKLEHTVEDKAKLKKVIPGIAEIAEAQSIKKEDYLLNRLARNMFREEKKELKKNEETDKALLQKSSLDIELVEEHAEDRRMAELMKFSTVKSFDEKQVEKRLEIQNRSLFGSHLKKEKTSPVHSQGVTDTKQRQVEDAKRKIAESLTKAKSVHLSTFSQSSGTSRKKTGVELGIVRKVTNTHENKLVEDQNERDIAKREATGDCMEGTIEDNIVKTQGRLSGVSVQNSSGLSSLIGCYDSTSEESN